MQIVFLDIDGVLNHHHFYETRYKGEEKTNPTKFEVYADMIDPKSVDFLNEIVDGTDAKFVISSTWRLGKTIEELQKLLDYHGFKGEIIGKTPRGCESCCRGNEIHTWIRDNEEHLGGNYSDYSSYVILDDDSDMLYWQRNNFLLVDGYIGITPNIAYKAIRILKGIT